MLPETGHLQWQAQLHSWCHQVFEWQRQEQIALERFHCHHQILAAISDRYSADGDILLSWNFLDKMFLSFDLRYYRVEFILIDHCPLTAVSFAQSGAWSFDWWGISWEKFSFILQMKVIYRLR